MLLRQTGLHARRTVLLPGDSDLNDDSFLEYLNSLLVTSSVPGLFSKDEMAVMCADLAQLAMKQVCRWQVVGGARGCSRGAPSRRVYRAVPCFIAYVQIPDFVETPGMLQNFFSQRVKKYLHVVLCMSPVSTTFAERARKFPGMLAVLTSLSQSPRCEKCRDPRLDLQDSCRAAPLTGF